MSYTFNDYQVDALGTATYPGLHNNLIYPALGLAGEAGEAADKIKKLWRNQGLMGYEGTTPEWRCELAKELGDVLWYIAALAEELQIDMETIAQMNIIKLRDRKERSVIKSEGDNR